MTRPGVPAIDPRAVPGVPGPRGRLRRRDRRSCRSRSTASSCGWSVLPLAEPFATAHGTRGRARRWSWSGRWWPTAPTAGASAWPSPSPPTGPSTRPAPSTCSSTTWCPACWPGARCGRCGATRWPRPRWSAPRSTPGCGPRAGRWPRSSGATRAGRPTGIALGLTRHGRRPGRRRPAPGTAGPPGLQAQGPAGLGRRAGAGRARRRSASEVALLADANGSYRSDDRRAPGHPRPAGRRRPRAGRPRAALRPRRPGGPRPAGRADRRARVPRRVDRLAGRPRRRRWRSGPAGRSASRSAGSAGWSRPGGSTSGAGTRAWRCGAAGCWRPASAGPSTWRSPRCPGCNLPPDLGPSARYFAADLTAPFDVRGGTMTVPNGPGLGSSPDPRPWTT